MTESPLHVSTEAATRNWLRSAVLGSALWPIVCFFPFNEEFNWGMVFIYFWIFIPSFFFSLLASLPAFLLFLFAGYHFNRRNLTFKKYVLLQNSIHLFAAAATFAFVNCFDFSLIGSDVRRLIWKPSISYTVSGIFIWNRMFYLLYKKAVI